MTNIKESWGSRIGLVLAMAGNAIGFGNFLRFPVQAIQNGGGAFIIPYLVCFLIMGIPLLLIEWSTGRFGGTKGHHSTPFILDAMNKKRIWKYVGVFGIFSNLTIAAYYCYMESWTLSYIFHSLFGTFNKMNQTQVADFFTNYLDISTSTTGIPFEAVIFFILCLSLNIYILSKGLSDGIEKAAKIGVPLLIVFGIFLAYKGITLKANIDGAKFDGIVGLNFLWTPKFDSLMNPKVWLAAAGQTFFTLSVGMGSIQCYASYVKKNEDIALNAMSAGWMNSFVEIVLGSAIIIPISIGYLGIDRVIDLTNLGGLGLGFRTMPFLFEQWGGILSAIAGVCFFGLLFFAGITSSLAMGTPCVGFLQDEFNVKKRNAALLFGISVLILSLPTIFFFENGVFDEYDYWAGTIALIIFALVESVLFAWIFGMDKGWKEITHGADIKIPIIFKYITKFITPTALLIVFFGSLLRPSDDNWSFSKINNWDFHPSSIIGQLTHKNIGPNNQYFANEYYAETDGTIKNIQNSKHKFIITIELTKPIGDITTKTIKLKNDNKLQIKKNQEIKTGEIMAKGHFTNNIFYIDLARILLLTVFLFISILVYIAYKKRKKSL